MENKDFMGKDVRDKVSNFKGVATGRVEYMSGTVEWLITGPSLEDKEPCERWVPEFYVELDD